MVKLYKNIKESFQSLKDYIKELASLKKEIEPANLKPKIAKRVKEIENYELQKQKTKEIDKSEDFYRSL